jgi:uracil-DNA glycosylase
MLDAYHVSFQNTNTGKLTAKMFDDVLKKAKLFVN